MKKKLFTDILREKISSPKKCWYKFIKTGRGFKEEYYFSWPHPLKIEKEDWQTLLEWVGEHTDGGSEDGYRINCRKLRSRPKALDDSFIFRWHQFTPEKISAILKNNGIEEKEE
jgi:hypothetical protein